MFHKGKRRRRFIAFVPAEASSFDSFSELERIATSFEPTLYQPDDHEPETSTDREEPRAVKSSGDEFTRVRTVFRSFDWRESFSFRLLPVANQVRPRKEDCNTAHPVRKRFTEGLKR